MLNPEKQIIIINQRIKYSITEINSCVNDIVRSMYRLINIADIAKVMNKTNEQDG